MHCPQCLTGLDQRRNLSQSLLTSLGCFVVLLSPLRHRIDIKLSRSNCKRVGFSIDISSTNNFGPGWLRNVLFLSDTTCKV